MQKLIQEKIDFPEISKQVLGKHAARFSPEEREEFSRVMSKFVTTVYPAQMRGIEKWKVGSYRETEDGTTSVVDITLIKNDPDINTVESEQVTLGLHKVDGQWKVYYVKLAGWWDLNSSLRSQADKILRRSNFSFDALRKGFDPKERSR